MVKERKATGIKSWPEDDRPREKLPKKVSGALNNSELLAILEGIQGLGRTKIAHIQAALVHL